MSSDILYLASRSLGRRMLLQEAGIDFMLLDHESDENLNYDGLLFKEYVLSIAKHKMEETSLPALDKVDKDYIFVLTADTLVRAPKLNLILTKPKDKQEAKSMLALERNGPIEVATAFCLAKYQKSDEGWQKEALVEAASLSTIEFYVDDSLEDTYFKNYPFVLNCAGAGSIEAFGGACLKSIDGSYSGVIGLPLYELFQALKQLNFKKIS